MYTTTPIAAIIRRTFLFSKACIRVSSVVNDQVFEGLFKKHALTVLEAISLQEMSRASSELVFMSYLIELAHEGGVIHPDNATALVKECDELQKEIQTSSNTIRATATKQEILRPSIADVEVKPVHESSLIGGEQEDKKGEKVIEDEVDARDSDKRQTAIFAKIKELGNCRLKDLMELLPDVSERTIRYDIQKLVDQGGIERVGGGGPFSFYRMKTA